MSAIHHTKDLIVAGFDQDHTALLARASLARMQKKISLSGYDLATVSRTEFGGITISEDVDLLPQHPTGESFWQSMASLLFAPDATRSNPCRQALQEIGIEEAFITASKQAIHPGECGLLLLVNPEALDSVVALLQGFRGRIKRTRLLGNNPHTWAQKIKLAQETSQSHLAQKT